MISVGVDIDRLGLMAVMGQPQMTAEYIQATSRVGGVPRPRRRHATTRRAHGTDPTMKGSRLTTARCIDEVESTSVTPFSSRARDRALHAVVVALVRMLIPEARENKSAAAVEAYHDKITNTIKPLLMARVEAVNEDEPGAVRNTGAEIDTFVDWWRERAELEPELVYRAAQRGRPRC